MMSYIQFGKLLFKCYYDLLSSLIVFHNQSKVGRVTFFCRNSVKLRKLGILVQFNVLIIQFNRSSLFSPWTTIFSMKKIRSTVK